MNVRRKRLLWLGGWASDLECWEPWIQEYYPAFEHRFEDTHRLISNTVQLNQLMDRYPETDAVLAWSMGSLWLHQALSTNTQKPASKYRFISLCPIYDFCGQGGWPERVLLRMRRQLKQNPKSVIRTFGKTMLASLGLESALFEEWEIQALRKCSEIELLDQGLEFLQTTTVLPQDIVFQARSFLMVAGAEDPIAPTLESGLFKSNDYVILQGGHCPFLADPTGFRSYLEAFLI